MHYTVVRAAAGVRVNVNELNAYSFNLAWRKGFSNLFDCSFFNICLC